MDIFTVRFHSGKNCDSSESLIHLSGEKKKNGGRKIDRDVPVESIAPGPMPRGQSTNALAVSLWLESFTYVQHGGTKWNSHEHPPFPCSFCISVENENVPEKW